MPTFRVLSQGSSIETEVRSSLHPIHGETRELRGEVWGEFDSEGAPQLDRPHGGRFELPVKSIRSGNRLNDMEMQRRAEADRYPTIAFEATRAWSQDGRYRVSVAVTARGQTRTIDEEFTLRREGRSVVLEGEHTFDMRDFGMNPPRILTLRVEPEVRVKVRVVAEAPHETTGDQEARA